MVKHRVYSIVSQCKRVSPLTQLSQQVVLLLEEDAPSGSTRLVACGQPWSHGWLNKANVHQTNLSFCYHFITCLATLKYYRYPPTVNVLNMSTVPSPYSVII